MKRFNYSGILLLVLIIQSCAPSRFVEPLEKNEISVGGSFGGPIIDFGAPIPMPMSSVEVGYGLDTNLTVFGALHLTAIYFGNLQMDAGASFKFLDQKTYRPNLSVSPSFNFVHNFEAKSTKFWPILDLNAWWNYGNQSNYFYVGVNNYFELSSTMANDQPQAQRWVFNPQIGHIVKGKAENWQLTTELKWLSPASDNTYAFVPFQTITGSHGAMAMFIGCRWIIGKKK